MAGFVVFKKDTGEIVRVQDGWKGEITEADKVRILGDHSDEIRPNLEIYILPEDGDTFPDPYEYKIEKIGGKPRLQKEKRIKKE